MRISTSVSRSDCSFAVSVVITKGNRAILAWQLQHGIDAYVVLGQNGRQHGNDSGFILDAKAQVIGQFLRRDRQRLIFAQ